MNFQQWLSLNESVLYQGEGVTIRDAEAGEIPRYFIHRTENPGDISSIGEKGFNLRLWGRTGRRFNTPSFLTKNDPRGIYAIAIDSPEKASEWNDRRPYVIFTADIKKALVLDETEPTADAKETLSTFMGGLVGTQLSNALKKMGYQAVLRSGSEQIILDPSIIQIVQSSE